MAKVFADRTASAANRPTHVWTVDPLLLSCAAVGQETATQPGVENPAFYDSESGLCTKKESLKKKQGLTWSENIASEKKQCNVRIVLLMAATFILLSVLVAMVTMVVYLAAGEAKLAWQEDKDIEESEEGVSLIEGHIRITNRVFTTDLLDPSSEAFLRLSSQVRQSMDAVFLQSLKYYNETGILGYSEGSVIARCRIHLSRPNVDATHQAGMAVIQALERHHGFLPGGLLQVDIRSLDFTGLVNYVDPITSTTLQLPEAWGPWSVWTSCIEDCEVQTRFRKCADPRFNCTGNDREVRNCPCDPTFKVKDEVTNEIKECAGDCEFGQICIILSPSSTSRCLVARDGADPTGCGGWCVGEHQLCKRLANATYQCADNAANCAEGSWKCENSLCIPVNKRCDGHMDCFDMSDELNCECGEEELKCGNNTSCLPLNLRCNGKVDCWDGSDEINCTAKCVEGKYTCNNGRCIEKQRFCDGYPDCEDASDEPEGCSAPCLHTQYQCRNRRCVNTLLWCNGVDNCGDGSDERACDIPKLLKSRR